MSVSPRTRARTIDISLLDAVSFGNVNGARTLVQNGANVDAPLSLDLISNDRGMTTPRLEALIWYYNDPDYSFIRDAPYTQQNINQTFDYFKQTYLTIRDNIDRFRVYAWFLGHGAPFDPNFDEEINN